ncbi:MAG TPA: DUF2066 domain-containing protein, partial [Steroidobacteraceae bacterium]|nr:DUF2066 domain-containing protein [Steroidobacteraceae bacterium]
MARDFNACTRHLRLWVFVCATFGSLGSSFALTRADLYQATAPVADRSEAAQTAAFEAALRTVLIRVTGRLTADADPAFAPLLDNARRYVQQYRAAPENQLWVAFDGAAIDRWLTQNNQPLWGRERPSTFVWLSVQTGPQSGTVVTADEGSELKSSIDATAMVRGAPIIWPSAADLQRNHLDYAGLASATPSSLAELGHRLGGAGILVGHANTSTLSAGVRWTYLFQDRSSEFSGSGTDGVNRAADTYASLYAVSGSLAPVDIEVTGVSDLKDYALVQSYLESMTFVSHVSVEGLSGDAVRFRLSTRGGAEPLQHAL